VSETVTGSGPHVDLPAMTAFLAAQPDVRTAYLFGSVAEGTANAMSDVDVAVLLLQCLGAEAELERRIELVVALEPYADREVQLVVLNSAPPVLAHEVIRRGTLLFQRDEEERVAFESLVYRMYRDFLPRADAFYEAAVARLREISHASSAE
jgi:uncharacterized protein